MRLSLVPLVCGLLVHGSLSSAEARQLDALAYRFDAPRESVALDPAGRPTVPPLDFAPFAELFPLAPDPVLAQAVAAAQPPPEPAHTGFGALVRNTAERLRRFPEAKIDLGDPRYWRGRRGDCLSLRRRAQRVVPGRRRAAKGAQAGEVSRLRLGAGWRGRRPLPGWQLRDEAGRRQPNQQSLPSRVRSAAGQPADPGLHLRHQGTRSSATGRPANAARSRRDTRR